MPKFILMENYFYVIYLLYFNKKIKISEELKIEFGWLYTNVTSISNCFKILEFLILAKVCLQKSIEK